MFLLSLFRKLREYEKHLDKMNDHGQYAKFLYHRKVDPVTMVLQERFAAIGVYDMHEIEGVCQHYHETHCYFNGGDLRLSYRYHVEE